MKEGKVKDGFKERPNSKRPNLSCENGQEVEEWEKIKKEWVDWAKYLKKECEHRAACHTGEERTFFRSLVHVLKDYIESEKEYAHAHRLLTGL